jgi:cytochrome c biogenesis protein CcdA
MLASSFPTAHLTVRVLLLALVAATSPLALASVLVVLTSGRGRINGLAFAIAFVTGQVLCCGLALSLGVVAAPDHDERFPTIEGLLIGGLGVALVALAVHFRRRRLEPRPSVLTARTEQLRTRLANLSVPTALGTGAVLGFGGPKRIGITLLAAATITASGASDASRITLGVIYVAVATLLVWVPVMLSVVFGHRAAEWLTAGQHWITERKDALTFWPTATLGVALIVDGAVQLLA